MNRGSYHTRDELLAYRYFSPVTLQNTGPIFPRPFPQQVAGEIRLGFVNSSRVILGLNRDELNQHALIFGRSGSGKTNIVRVIQAELLRTGIPFLAFDVAKHNSRYCITRDYPTIIRWNKEFSFNPFAPPPQTSVIEWLMDVCEVTTDAFGVKTAGKSLMIHICKSLYEKFDSEKTGHYPTMRDFHRALEERKRKAKARHDRVDLDYIERILNKVNAILVVLEDQLNVNKGLPIEDILHYPVCIEFVGLTIEIQTWLVNMIVSWIATYRRTRAEFSGLKHVVFWDEASNTFSKHKTENTETFLIHQTRLLRESGEAIVFADQSIGTINDVIKSNIYAFVCLSQSSPIDLKESAAILSLDSEQKTVLNQLEPGQGIIKLAGKHPHSVLINFPYVQPKYVTEKEIDEINVNDKILRDLLRKVEFCLNVTPDLSHSNETEESKPKEQSAALTTKTRMNLKKLLEATATNPFDRSTDILRKAGFSGSSGNAIKTFAINNGYVNEHIINMGTRGAVSKYFEITDEGYRFLDEVLIEYQKPKGKGGFEHRLYQNILAKYHCGKATHVEIESANEGDDSYVLVDVIVKNANGMSMAYEVEFNVNQHIIQNILKCVEANYSEITIVTKKDLREKILHFIEENLDNSLKDMVKVKSINDFLQGT